MPRDMDRANKWDCHCNSGPDRYLVASCDEITLDYNLVQVAIMVDIGQGGNIWRCSLLRALGDKDILGADFPRLLHNTTLVIPITTKCDTMQSNA